MGEFVNNGAPGGIGAFPASLAPSQNKVVLESNYLKFDGEDGVNFSQQYLPELYEAEVERYGNRTLSAFLRMVGAEMPMTSDQVIWSEQNRLHVSYNEVVIASTNSIDITVPAENTGNCAIRKGQTVAISNGYTTVKAYVTAAPTGAGVAWNVTVECYQFADLAAAGLANGDNVTVFVYGSEFAKGTEGMDTAIEPVLTQFSNKPIIIKDFFEVSGSDAAQIGWVEIATEEGASGYLWYLKSESETRLRFEDYLEMAMVEGELRSATSGIPAGDKIEGTQGMFAAIEERGLVYEDFAAAPVPANGSLGDFDNILQQLDKQGAIEENMLFLNRSTALDFDDMLGAIGAGYDGGTSYGLFDNEADMALNLGFSGFRRGSYDFYKTDWKYLNDASTRGLTKDIDGVLVPAGTTTVYDQMMGSNIRRPFLHVRYRASEADDRRMKSWVTGSVGGAYTSSLDAMQIHFLSERCLVTQAANNFVLFTATANPA